MEEINTVQEVKELNLDELNEVSGGSRGDERHKLRNYIALTVSNLPKGEYLVMQRKPRGAFMSVKFICWSSVCIARSWSWLIVSCWRSRAS